MHAAEKHEARSEKLAAVVAEARGIVEQARAAEVERARTAAEATAEVAAVVAAKRARLAALAQVEVRARCCSSSAPWNDPSTQKPNVVRRRSEGAAGTGAGLDDILVGVNDRMRAGVRVGSWKHLCGGVEEGVRWLRSFESPPHTRASPVPGRAELDRSLERGWDRT
jgi:hypothetical protein